jgi:hypothetical protein
MRLKFRIAFLTAVSLADQRDMTLSKEAWDELVALLPGVSISHELSKPVPDAFSVKLQRKLASTVPPRPVVTIAFEAAYKHLERLCHDGRALAEILNYHDSHSLMVCIELSRRTIISVLKFSDICHPISDQKAAAFSIYPHLVTILHLRRHDGPWKDVNQAAARRRSIQPCPSRGSTSRSQE